ncbi:benzoate degradation ring-cleavage hydrolase [Rhodovastum atsumiense]|uniref:Alpha/beta hydrolase n=1 Tax=Rhodovastum atsumiense TaxID=504468 RepID=A0A5M6ITS5_9PROT|nr:alpha/beta hydrolase [Rhodovastum atsumiense]KAA5611720.1 alpha/beta hydrolase [Rhodovastum atsumiense]CAH2604298.1 benzoate degradation ring-cleavage hydrolase [Rhodovastum atsumiense]
MTRASREWRISLSEGELEAAWWGAPPEAAPSFVLLHEGLGCISLWRDLPAWLAGRTGFGVFAYSRLGYGKSGRNPAPWPLDYLRREAGWVLPRVLDAAEIRQAVLIGHSDGGSIAAIHAATQDDPRIAGLVLIAPHFLMEPQVLAGITAAREAYLESDFRVRLGRYHAHVDDAFWGWNRAWLDPAFARDFDLSGDLRNVSKPMLVIQGEDDPYGTAAQPEAAARLARAEVEVAMIPGARHAPHLEAPDRTRPLIAAFSERMLKRI